MAMFVHFNVKQRKRKVTYFSVTYF